MVGGILFFSAHFVNKLLSLHSRRAQVSKMGADAEEEVRREEEGWLC